MSEAPSLLQLFIYPAVEVMIAVLAAGYLLRRSKKTLSYLQWSFGCALLVASVCAGLALTWLYVEVKNTESFGFLIVLIAPSLPFVVIGMVALLCLCVCFVWGAAQNRFVTRMGFLKGPGTRTVTASISVLVFAGTVGVYLALPTLHLLPYRELSSDNRSGLKTLKAIRFNDEFVPLITVGSNQWPEYDHSFRLKLNWRGQAVLDVWHRGSATEPESTMTYYLPFIESTYQLEDGIPKRT